MPPSPRCVCGHAAEGHHRAFMGGTEVCDGLDEFSASALSSCRCNGYVPITTPQLCFCGHMAGMHLLGTRTCRFEKLCGCTAYRAIPPVPVEQLRYLAADQAVVVVVVPVEDWDDDKKTAEVIAGDLTDQAHIVMVQKGPGLYYVSKHPERDKVGGLYSTEDSFRENLLRIKRNLDKR